MKFFAMTHGRILTVVSLCMGTEFLYDEQISGSQGGE
jgi:hypothetical protein